MKENKRVLIGMSGGGDSSVSAILLKKQGYEVVGATIQLWKDKEKNQVIVGMQDDLYANKLNANEIHFLVDFNKLEKNLDGSVDLFAEIRFQAKEAKAKLYFNQEENTAKVIFEEDQRAITPGQSVVFYIEDILIGGGKII